MQKLKSHYAAIVATLALVVALVGVPGVTAGGLLITSKQIKNGTIASQDIRTSAVKASDIGKEAVGSADIKTGAVLSADIGTGQVTSSDIGDGEVEPGHVTMPDPVQIKFGGTAGLASPTLTFAPLATLGTYQKQVADSALQIDWTGSVKGENGGEASGCVFQIRVDGQPSPAGGGEVFGRGLTGVAASALFSGLPAGSHVIEIWARLTITADMGNSCTVGPPAAGIGQTVVLAEQVI